MTASSPENETATFEDLQEPYDAFFVPRFTVDVGGERFTESQGIVSNLSVDTSVDAATTFSFTLNYRWNTEHATFEGLDWERFSPGTGVTIRMGYGDADQVELCRGRIASVSPSFPAGSTPTVDVSGYGLLHELTDPPSPGEGRDSWTRTWTEAAPHEVVEKLVAERGYDFKAVHAEPVDVTPPEIKQEDNQHDLQFLLELAETYAHELFVREGELYFRPARYDGKPDLELEYGESLESFTPRVDSTDEVDRVEVRNWDPERGSEIVGTAIRSGFDGDDPTTVTVRLSVRDAAEATARAEAVLANYLDGTVEGSGETVGIPRLRPGTRLRIRGLTDRFTATYYVESATHQFSSSGYRTSFDAKRREL